METGILVQQYNEARKIVASYENGDISYEKAMNLIRIRSQERMVAKAMVAMALGFARMNEDKLFKETAKALLGSGKKKLTIELPKKLYDRTSKRGRKSS